MQNRIQILNYLKSVYEDTRNGVGQTVALIAESGIGKTYIAEQFLKYLENKSLVVRIKGTPTASSALSAVYNALYNMISQGKVVKKEYYIGLLKRYTKVLPGFAQFASLLISQKQSDVYGEVLASTGLNVNTSPNPQIIRFIQEIGRDSSIIVISDDCQWLDSASWEFLVYLAENAKHLGWLFLFLYNDRVYTWENRNEHFHTIDYWKTHAESINWKQFIPKRWPPKELPTLCSNILGKPSRLSNDQISILFKYSGGIPQYVKSILEGLREQSYIIYTDNIFVGKGDWNDIDIAKELRDSIGQRLQRVYHAIEGSRSILEIGCVIGERFQESDVDSLLNIKDSYTILTKISMTFGVIKYIFKEREWTFDHTLIHREIYDSLGSECRKLHIRIAKHFEKKEDASPITISYHYHRAGEVKKAMHFKLLEASRLTSVAMYGLALTLIGEINSDILETSIQLSIEDLTKITLLRGHCLFRLNKYKDAFIEFKKLLEISISEEIRAQTLRWIGRCYTSLDTQEDAELGLKHHEEAIAIYKKLSDKKQLAETLTELVVVYAHLNRYQNAKIVYTRAEEYFNDMEDYIGLARLQRRNGIFMDGRIAAPDLERVSNIFSRYKMPDERIMALNNASVAFLYLGNLKKAQALIETALKEATEFGNFGLDCIYNNLAIINITSNKLSVAEKYTCLARDNCNREVTKVIIDISNSVIVMQKEGIKTAVPILRKILHKTKVVGEVTYMLPAIVNLSYALAQLKQYGKAIKYLELLKPFSMNSAYSHIDYQNSRWFQLLKKCYLLNGNTDVLANLEKQYGWCSQPEGSIYYKPSYALVAAQFWSD